MIECNAELVQQLAQNLHHRDVLSTLNFACGFILAAGLVGCTIITISAWDRIHKKPTLTIFGLMLLCAIGLTIANFVVPTNSAIATIASFCQMQVTR